MNRFLLSLILLLVAAQRQYAQQSFDFEITWSESSMTFEIEEGTEISAPTFEGALHSYGDDFAPVYFRKIPLAVRQEVVNVSIEALETNAAGRDVGTFMRKAENAEPGSLRWHVREERGRAVLLIEYLPVIAQGGGYALVQKARLHYSPVQAMRGASAKSDFVENSVMAQGDWYRLAVLEDGMYRINRALLQSMGINVNNVNPQDINIFGNGFGQLPFENSVPRPDDLLVNRIHIEGEADGSFDEDDYILFYAKGPHSWSYNQTSQLFDHNKHDYSDTSYYFIGIQTGIAPARVATQAAPPAGRNYTVSSFNDYSFHEVDRENVLKSGRQWYGERFDIQTIFNFGGSNFSFPNIVSGTETVVRANVIARSTGTPTIFRLELAGANTQIIIPRVFTTVTSSFANPGQLELRLNNAPSAMNIVMEYQKGGTPSASGWLNWINVNTRRQLLMAGNQMIFRDVESIGPGRISGFDIGNASSVAEVWEVTEPHQATRMPLVRTGSTASFTRSTEELREFVAFTGSGYLQPLPAGRVANQNLHALGGKSRVDMVIVSPGSLRARAEELADLHRNYQDDPLSVEVVSLLEVYNEFSSGMRDITAIKWLMKMLYDKAGGNEALMPKYLLLFGDGSFDNRNTTPGNTNLVPTYQSFNSLSPVNSYVSDDYFGFLGDDEGESQLDVMDIGVGRITIKNAQEATSVIGKIRRYMEVTGNMGANCSTCTTAGGGFGPWRNIIALVADDEDGNSHMRNSQSIATRINNYTRAYNLERIFMDAFQQIATPGGARYPDVNKAIDRRVQNGAFIINYIGHGGVLGWAQERVLDIPTILAWDNRFAMPIFMTATCEFTRFDDPLRTSAGEYVLLNGNGGGIALMTTTRLVFSGPNFALNERFYDALFTRPSGEVVTRLGDISRDTKNSALSSSSANHRNFSLIGDPALPLAIPRKEVHITAITDTLGQPVDTLKALGVFRVSGEVRNTGAGIDGAFQGRLNATVLDREKDVVTLANDGGVPFQFRQQEDVVHRGNAEVINGKFLFDFVIPKDISFAVDTTARISLYAFSEKEDGRGFANDLSIGDRDPNAVDDGTGPAVELFLNDENFVFGGFTNSTPTLVARVFDLSGINTVGTGVGHDITANLDNDPQKTFVLNDFYESDLNTFQSGRIMYQFDELEPGNHDLTLRVWNVHNRSTESKTSFIVADNEEFALKRILNYPNPFTTYTEFFFEHNQSCAFLNVQIQVYTVSGKLVKSIITVSNTDGFRTQPIAWDGRDDYGDRLATGVYVYKVSVRNPAGEQVDKFEKLVILN